MANASLIGSIINTILGLMWELINLLQVVRSLCTLNNHMNYLPVCLLGEPSTEYDGRGSQAQSTCLHAG
jgi:hypothetical protein